MTEKRQRWLLAVGYILFIYATLGVVRGPVGALRAMGLLRLSLGVLYIACFGALFYLLARRKSLDAKRLAYLLMIAGLYYAVAHWVKTPEEQIHFFQYGLVGVFFFRALESGHASKTKVFFLALVLASGAGWIDEIIQGLIPSRHYDTRDIFLNILSAFLGLLTHQIVSLPSPETKKHQN